MAARGLDRNSSRILCAQYTLFGKSFSFFASPKIVSGKGSNRGEILYAQGNRYRNSKASVIMGLIHLGGRLYFHFQRGRKASKGDAGRDLQDTNSGRSWDSLASIPLPPRGGKWIECGVGRVQMTCWSPLTLEGCEIWCWGRVDPHTPSLT